MKSKTCCFTGHRRLPEDKHLEITAKLENAIVTLIHSGYLYFGTGGALGFDTLCAQVILHLQKSYPKIKLILVLPCVSQADRWSAADKAVYEEIMRQANKVVYTSKQYTRDCMFKRNRHLVDCSSICICYQVKDSGGTAYTTKYAKKCGLQIINLAKQVWHGHEIFALLAATHVLGCMGRCPCLCLKELSENKMHFSDGSLGLV